LGKKKGRHNTRNKQPHKTPQIHKKGERAQKRKELGSEKASKKKIVPKRKKDIKKKNFKTNSDRKKANSSKLAKKWTRKDGETLQGGEIFILHFEDRGLQTSERKERPKKS